MKTRFTHFFGFLLLFSAVLAGCSEDDGTSSRDPLAFTIDPETIDFPANGGNAIINIHLDSARPWSLDNPAPWITVTATSGTGISHISIAVAANQSVEARATTLTVTSEGETHQVAITQAGAEPEPVFTYDIEPDPSNMGTLTSVELAAQMGTGWNLGNSLEAIGGETAWGNPMTTQALMDAVKAAGFNTVRIPVSWSVFTNANSFTIDPAWLNRVEEVVNYALSNNMYVIMNEHWDGGWMQPTAAQKDYVNNRLAVMWKQIATHFRDYDYHLIFAGTNEVMVEGDYNTPTSEYYTTQNSFNQTFVTAVRATGGRNAYRYLAVQGFNTNISHTVNFFDAPEDVTENRLLVEVHYYDPYNFTLNENSTITQWGAIATDPPATETWANESYVDAQFQAMKTNFTDQGFGVILGEFGAIVRQEVSGSETFREYYIDYVSTSARNHGLVPVYWDNGFIGNHAMALFNRNTGEILYPGILAAVMP